MGSFQLILCLFGISAILLVDIAQARSARQLEGESIVGGDVAKEAQFPYQVFLHSESGNFCGGSILSDRYILTAAHCVINEFGQFTNLSMWGLAGVSNLEYPSIRRVYFDVVEAFVPLEHNPTFSQHFPVADIAVLKTDKNLGIANHPKVAKIKIPSKIDKYDGVKATVTGFGSSSIELVTNPKTGKIEEVNEIASTGLRFATAKVLKNKDCQKNFMRQITDKHLCAAIVQRKKNKPEGLCSGDSGGPLVYNGVQIAVVSSSPDGCREDSKPAIYTRVSSYLDFINKVLSGKIDNTIRSNTLPIFVIKTLPVK